MNIDWNKYEQRVLELEEEGLTTSDAQGIVDVELQRNPTNFLKDEVQ